MPEHASDRTDLASGRAAPAGRFRTCWLAETLRLRETLWGPLEDAAETRQARALGGSFADRLGHRARALARRENLDVTLGRWSGMARLALLIMALAALLAGAGAALGALGDGGRPVNVMLALAALLGLNALTFVFWLASFAFTTSSQSGSWLGGCWLWLTRRLARGPDAALAPRALVELLERHKALRWTLGGVSHALWTLALGCAVVTLLAILSTRRYSFNWETTLLSPDTFVWLTSALGWLPVRLGFAMPTPDMVRASDGLAALPATAQTLWSSWLIGCIVTYGLIPRVAALILSLGVVRSRLRRLTLDTGLPGFAELRDRLDPASERAGVDKPPGDDRVAGLQPASQYSLQPGQAALAGIELAPNVPWPPAGLPPDVANMGVIESGGQRRALLERLAKASPVRLLLICDARQTPDRGTINLLAELASLAQETRIALAQVPKTADAQPPSSSHTVSAATTPLDDVSGAGEPAPRTRAWLDRLQAAGFAREHIIWPPRQALNWLAGETLPAPASQATGTKEAP